MENTEDYLVKRVPHILICEGHNALISAMPNSFHNIVSKEYCEMCLCNVYVSHWNHFAPTTNCNLYVVVKKEWVHKDVQS